jgi:hypothetical protein
MVAGNAYSRAYETTDLVSLNMAAPVRTVSNMRDNPETLNRSGVYIYNTVFSENFINYDIKYYFVILCPFFSQFLF